MKAGAGRIIFFDKLAEGLQSTFYRGFPPRLALSVPSQSPRVPEADVKSLARALCRWHLPDAENIPELRFFQATSRQRAPAGILNAEGRKLNVVLDKIKSGDYPEISVVFNFENDESNFPRLNYDPRVNADIISDALQVLFSANGMASSAMARIRLEESGFVALESFGVFDNPFALNWEDAQTLELFYYRLSRSWTYRGYPVPVDTIRGWVAQFSEAGFSSEAHQLLMYLQQYGFVTETSVVEGLAQHYFNVDKQGASNVVAINVQKAGKSEQKLAYRLRPHILLKSIDEVLPAIKAGTVERPTLLVCFDDCVGSGESMEKYLFDADYNTYRDDLIASFHEKRSKLFVIVFHADIRAICRLESSNDAANCLRVLPVRIMDDTHRAFSSGSRIFRTAERRAKFMEFCKEIGGYLLPGSPLGWDDCQWVISYDYSIPNNSLPVLFGTSNAPYWRPLFERGR